MTTHPPASPCTTGLAAVYTDPETGKRYRPVQGFDGHGVPLVLVGVRDFAHLVPANSLPGLEGFTHPVPSADYHPALDVTTSTQEAEQPFERGYRMACNALGNRVLPGPGEVGLLQTLTARADLASGADVLQFVQGAVARLTETAASR